MNRVLVTGAFGFIGSALCERLSAQGIHVRALGRNPKEGTCTETVTADLSQPPLDSAIFEGIDTIFHLASHSEPADKSGRAEENCNRVNAEGTKRLLEGARDAGVRRFVFFSTVKAMGENTPVEPVDELAVPAPETPYGRSKLTAERHVLEGGFVPEPVVLRFPMVYGGKKSSNIQKMIRAVRGHRFPPIPEFGNGRSMIHVNDAIDAAILAATHADAAGELFLVTDGELYSTRQIYNLIRKGLGKSGACCAIPKLVLRLLAIGGDAISIVTRRRFPFDTDALNKLYLSASYSSDKIQRQLGFRPAHNLRTAMAELIAQA